MYFAVSGSKSSLIIETLLKNGANPNIISCQRRTLDQAKNDEQESISELLIKYGGQTRVKLEGTKEKELNSTSHEQNTIPISLQTTDELTDIKLMIIQDMLSRGRQNDGDYICQVPCSCLVHSLHTS